MSTVFLNLIVLVLILSPSEGKNEMKSSHVLNTAEDTTITDLIYDIIMAHETIRTRHQVNPLIWDDKLNVIARERALQRAKYHGSGLELDDIGDNLGENWHFALDEGKPVGSKEAIDFWYTTQKKLYDSNNPMVNSSNINFAQMAAKTSKYFGCGQSSFIDQTGDQGYYLVCLYYPRYIPGNEKENIFDPLNLEDILPFSLMVAQFDGCKDPNDVQICNNLHLPRNKLVH